MKQHLHLYLLLGFSLSLVACGGGGGGSSTSSSSSINYTGSSSAANIDSNNAQNITGDSTTSGAVGGTASSVATVNADGQTKKTGTSIISQAVVNAVENRIDATDSGTLAATVSSNTVAGSCGGSETFTINVDSTTNAFNGSMSFANYCDTDVIISGSATLSGTIDTSTTRISINMTFNSLLIENKTRKRIFKAENYKIVISDNYSTSSFSVSLSGKFYHPDYGYVMLSTITPLQYSGSSEWPSSGKLKVTEDGTAPVDSATLSVIDTTQYQVDVDISNDGSIDSTNLYNWADL